MGADPSPTAVAVTCLSFLFSRLPILFSWFLIFAFVAVLYYFGPLNA